MQTDLICGQLALNRVLHALRARNIHFAIDVKSRTDKWRIILQPLDEKEEVFDPCNIDEIAVIVEIVEIREVSAHYE